MNLSLLFCTAAACTAACVASPSPVAEKTIPWKEITVYSVDEKTGVLLKSRAMTPDSKDYAAYSIYQGVEGIGDDSRWRQQFQDGFYAYKREKDPVCPFSLVRLLPPPEIVRIMDTFPVKNQKVIPLGDLRYDAERYMPLRHDGYTPYWRRVDMILGMVQAEGRIYFFPDRKEQAKSLHWDGQDRYKLRSVINFPDDAGLLAAVVVSRNGDQKETVVMIDPATGKSSPAPAGYDASFRFDNRITIKPNVLSIKDSGRWGTNFEVVDRHDSSKNMVQGYTGDDMSEDIIVMDGKAWCGSRKGAVLLYPEPWARPGDDMAVTLESRGSQKPGDMEFSLTLANNGKKPLSLQQGWGNVVLRFSGDARFTDNFIHEVELVSEGVVEEESFPGLTLEPGKSVSATIYYSCPDWRIVPRGPSVFIKATVSTFGKAGTPGHGMYTSVPIEVRNPVTPR